MLRNEQRHDPATISDRELGSAALLLLLAVVLAVVFVPAIGLIAYGRRRSWTACG